MAYEVVGKLPQSVKHFIKSGLTKIEANLQFNLCPDEAFQLEIVPSKVANAKLLGPGPGPLPGLYAVPVGVPVPVPIAVGMTMASGASAWAPVLSA